MVELKGSLTGIGLPAIIQLIGELHHSGRLELTKLPDRGELGFDDGRLVSASFADQRGLKALAACARHLADAEFRFVESRHTSERTIDIGAPELQLYLTRLMRGDAPPEPVSEPHVKPAEVVAPGPCPYLGFADDPSRHYSRPTALHRCFAAGAAGLVTGLEQRELCLAGRYTTCPRYQTATAAAPAAVEPTWQQPPAPPSAAFPSAPPPSAPFRSAPPPSPTYPAGSPQSPAYQAGPAQPVPPPAAPGRSVPPQPAPPQPVSAHPSPPTAAPPTAAPPIAAPPTAPPPTAPPTVPPPTAPPPQAAPPRSGPPEPASPPSGPYRPVPPADLPPPLFPPPPTAAPSELPAGVAARLAAADQMQAGNAAAADVSDPADRTSADRASRSNGQFTLPPASRRRGLLIAVAAVLGIIVLAGVLAVVVPALEGGSARQGTQSFEPVATPARTVVATNPSTVPVGAARPSPVAAAPSAVAPRPTAAPGAGVTASQPTTAPSPALAARPSPATSPSPITAQLVLDALFSTGPSSDWRENPPYATWSDGAYRLVARDKGNFVAVGVPVDGQLSDVIVSATFRKTAGPPGGGYGLIVRSQSAQPLDGANQSLNAYVLETGDKGEFGVWRRDGDHFVDLVPWMQSSTVRAGGSPNDLLVRAVGAEFTFLVNGTEVARVEDATLTTGGVGVFVGGDNNEVALDHFTVQLPN